MKKANKALLVALLGAGLVLASCGGTETSSSTPAESTTTSASSEAEASSETHGESSSESVSLPDSSDTSSTPDVVEDYLVDIVETTGVHITSNLERAKPGDTVTLTVTVDPGYVLTSLTMNGEALTAATDGTYSFTMPDRDATIRATVTVEGEVTIGGSVSAAFTENGDGTKNVRAIGEAVEGSVYDYVPFTASANVFDINDDGQYVLRPNIVYINKAIFCGAYGRLIDPNTLTMDVDAEGRITTIEYMAEMTYGNDLERVDIKNYGTAALPSDIASQVENLEPFVTPTSWEDENPDIASKLTSILGSDAASVPYVYVPSVHGKLEALIGGEMEDRVNICSKDFYDFDSTDFVDAYREAVIAAGYVLTIPAVGSQGDVYVKGNVAIEIGSQDFSGIFVYRYTAA